AKRYFQAGTGDYRRGRFREAEANFTMAIKLLPGDVPALEWRAYVRTAMGRLDEAQQDVDAAIKLDPENRRMKVLEQRIEAARNGSK
ncbi:MAG: hypothetical protein ACE5JI_23335, partial [Acidobacteriota bacterium]